MISSNTVILLCVGIILFGPYLSCPTNSRSAIDQTFVKEALPSLLVTSVRLSAPICRYRFTSRLSNVVLLVSDTDGVISAPERIVAVSARGEDILFEPRQIRDPILLGPLIAGTAR